MKNNNSFTAIARPDHEAIRKLLSFLGNPQNGMRFIHIAGTNGKGSVCAYLQCILTDAGFITGKFISPHMLDERERISIDGEMISMSDFDSLMEKVKAAANHIAADSGITVTQFELWCACAFCYFKENSCDFVVLETGLGGRQDATNIIEEPVITVITRISLDHTELLGSTLSEIAKEKSGIIKRCKTQGHTITVEQDKAVMDVISAAARAKDNKFTVVTPPSCSEFSNGCETFSYNGISDIKSRMLGEYQKENAACAVECALALGIDSKHILSGIYNATNPGRFEILSKSPVIVFDGAHNQNGIKAMAESLNKYFPGNKFNFIISFMRGKNIKASVDAVKSVLGDVNMRFYAVEVKNTPRAEKSSVIYEILKNDGLEAFDSKTLKAALNAAVSDDRITVICGSLYFYNDFFEVFKSTALTNLRSNGKI